MTTTRDSATLAAMVPPGLHAPLLHVLIRESSMHSGQLQLQPHARHISTAADGDDERPVHEAKDQGMPNRTAVFLILRQLRAPSSTGASSLSR
eukprot:CAMPEP_0118993052 /NCGR_PEP_ID=MMETSP1173-20130426/54360_1 /TAXON_ID=1034831 /ORGANISM="Rhizochromulina marina cf, Strain CCMP1243" /LENGTH=92 /DNA_ID=CAMNT_0006944275 /DNA_START=126 /DNA_END=404 /DNA_ORIENTATION=-